MGFISSYNHYMDTNIFHIPSDVVVTNEPQMWRAAHTLISCCYTAFGQRLVT